jgi:hypothetical protein
MLKFFHCFLKSKFIISDDVETADFQESSPYLVVNLLLLFQIANEFLTSSNRLKIFPMTYQEIKISVNHILIEQKIIFRVKQSQVQGFVKI